jgi:hypothetical protein
MNGWQMWHAVRLPMAEQPVFRHLYRAGSLNLAAGLRLPAELQPVAARARTIAYAVLPPVMILLGFPLMLLLGAALITSVVVIVPGVNTAYALAGLLGAQNQIAGVRRRRIYDLLCASPTGWLGIHRTLYAGWHARAPLLRAAVLTVLYGGMGAGFLGLAPQFLFGAHPYQPVIALTQGAALALILALDHIYAAATSSVLAILIPGAEANDFDSRLYSVSAFIAVQIAVYGAALALAHIVLPAALMSIGVTGAAVSLALPVLMLAAFWGLRELAFRLCWHAAAGRVKLTGTELDSLTQRAL